MAWLLNYRRLALRYDRTQQTITALLTIACTPICHRKPIAKVLPGGVLVLERPDPAAGVR